MTDVRLLTRLWIPSVRKRIFGGFSVILLLLAVLANHRLRQWAMGRA